MMLGRKPAGFSRVWGGSWLRYATAAYWCIIRHQLIIYDGGGHFACGAKDEALQTE